MANKTSAGRGKNPVLIRLMLSDKIELYPTNEIWEPLMRKILSFVLLSLLLCVSVCAAGTDGYLFGLADGAVLLCADDGIECISAEAGIYRADTLEDIRENVSPAQLDYIEPNGTVSLPDTSLALPDSRWDLSVLQANYPRLLGLAGQGVRVGIVDSGISADHPNLEHASIVPGWNYYSNIADTTDTFGHGTFIAGLLAGHSAENSSWLGLCPRAELVPLKCFEGRSGYISQIAAAITDAVDKYDCQVINLSFGTPTSYSSLESALSYAADHGVLCIASSGNDGNSTAYYPAAYDFVVGVGAVDADRARADFSQINDTVHICAPGKALTSLNYQGGFVSGNGTSYACAYVTAAAVLVRQAMPSLTVQGFFSLLARTAEDLGEEGYDTAFGYGLLDLRALVHAAFFSLSGTDLQGLFTPDAMVPLWAAAYSSAGQLLQCQTVPLPEQPASQTLDFPDQTARIKLFFPAADTLSPALEPLEWTIEPVS